MSLIRALIAPLLLVCLAAGLQAWEGRAEIGAGPSELFSGGLAGHYEALKKSPGYQSSAVDSVAVYFGLEADFENHLLLAGGVNFGPTFDLRLIPGAGASYSETFNLSNAYIMPGLRWAPWAGDFSLVLGIPLGYAYLSGSSNYSDGSGSSLAGVGGSAFSAGVTLRAEYALISWISLGSDAGYTSSGAISPSYILSSGSTLYQPGGTAIDPSGFRTRIYFSLHPTLPRGRRP